MSIKVGTVYWEITGDDSGFNKAYSRTDKKTESLANSFKKVDIAAKVFGEQSQALAKKQNILRSRIEGLISNGVDPANKGFKKLTDQYQKNQKELDSLSQKNKGFGTLLKGFVIGALAGVAYKLKSMFDVAIDKSSAAQETIQKFGNVFPEILPKAQETAKELQNVANITLTESKAMLAFGGNVFTSTGLGEEAALSYSRVLGQMAADLKSFNNDTRSTSEIMQVLTKATLGERDALVGLGIKVSENDMTNYAASIGKVWKNLSQQEKAQLSVNMLVRRTANAYGDVQKSAESYEYIQRKIANQTTDMEESFGQKVLPALTSLKQSFSDNISKGGAFSVILDGIGNAISQFLDKINAAIKGLEYFQAKFSAKEDWKMAYEEANKYGTNAKRILGMVQSSREEDLKLRLKLNEISGKSETKETQEIRSALKIKQQMTAQRNVENQSLQEYLKFTKLSIGLEKRKQNVAGGGKGPTTPGGGSPVSTRAKESVKEMKILKREAKSMLDHYAKMGASQVDLVEMEKEEELAKVQEFEKKKLLTEQQAAGLRERITAESSKKIKDIYMQESWQVMDATMNGISSIVSAMQQASAAQTAQKSKAVEEARQTALEQAGVAEETAVEQAAKELEEAKKKGKKEEIIEKEKALKKAKINEDYDKKKSLIEYQGELRGWEYQKTQAKISLATAIMNAVKTGFGAPFPLSLIMPGIQAGIATASFAVQQEALAASKPQKPKFAEGGIVPGTSYTGDRVNAGLNSREGIFTLDQQKTLFDIANGQGNNGSMVIHNYINIDGEPLWNGITKATKRGDIKVSDKSITKF